MDDRGGRRAVPRALCGERVRRNFRVGGALACQWDDRVVAIAQMESFGTWLATGVRVESGRGVRA